MQSKQPHIDIITAAKDNMTDSGNLNNLTIGSNGDKCSKVVQQRVGRYERRYAPYAQLEDRKSSSRIKFETTRIFVQNLHYEVETQELKEFMEKGSIAIFTYFSSHKRKLYLTVIKVVLPDFWVKINH